MSQSYRYTKNEFSDCKNVTWEDILEKINHEYLHNTHRFLMDFNKFPSFVLHNEYYPKTIQSAYDEVQKKYNIQVLHIYSSFVKGSAVAGRHADMEDVIIVQSIGKMMYIFDDGSEVIMTPGDSLFIPEGVHHNPVAWGPRVSFSFSW